MPRIHGVRQRLHQPQWDSLIRQTGGSAVAGNPTINSTQLLFSSPQTGNLARTNMTVAGQLASDQTYIVLALRCYLFFDGVGARDLYQQVSSQLFFTFTLGEKPQFTMGAYYHCAGGGIWSGGFGGAADDAVYANGVPSQESILKLARPIVIPVRQAISVSATFFDLGSASALALVNGADDNTQQICTYIIDGLKTRDVE
jgi:hypothetical protein